jgi:hypothetical protein
VAQRSADDAIVVIEPDAVGDDGSDPEVASALIAVVRRDVLHRALGESIAALARQRTGQVPFVVIDRSGTTVVFMEIAPAVTAPGGVA